MDDIGSSKPVIMLGGNKWLNFLNILFLFLMVFPFVAIIIGFFSGGDLFFWFPTGLEILLPIGIIVFLVQILRIIKRQYDAFTIVSVGCSSLMIIMGVFGWMLIFVVTS